MTEYVLFLDMDGPLCDFILAFKNLSEKTIGKPVDINTLDRKISNKMIKNAGIEFWENMPPVPDMPQLISFVKDNFLYIKILSSTSKQAFKTNSVEDGKKLWLRHYNIPVYNDDIILVDSAQDKQHYAIKNGILVDDYKKNVDSWISKGGIGILHTSANDTIKQLQKYV